MTLEETIDQVIALGASDPREVAEKVLAANDASWLASELVAWAPDILSEIARRKLGAVRRNAEIALRPGDAMAQSDLMLAKAWVPSVGWKPAGRLTRADLVARREWYRRAAAELTRRVAWHDLVIELMDREGVEQLGQVRASLPELPAVDAELLVAV